ncbi:pro-MCH isoform X1 [Acipenser ruthenus]|uniref:pro-MCH isoform X1 n=2 Tax=Acipenser ruthenus TaxID=7906 RepID=UPI00145A0AAD|nr:pro-MCH isoform X1 [Acipenser ruthenus]
MARKSISTYSVLFALAFLSESLIASVARSLNKIEETRMLNDFFSPSKAHLDAEGLDKSGEAFSKYSLLEGTMMDEGGSSKIIVFTDLGVKKNAKDLQDFLISANSKLFSPALSVDLSNRHLPYFTVREAEAPQSESQSTATEERRDSGRDDSKIPVGKRDFDMLRCMLGRVYRPCWQV